MIKKNYCITLLCITFATTAFGMESENINQNKGWLAVVTDSLLHGIKPLEQFLSQDIEYNNLRPREQKRTILFLTDNDKSRTLDNAAHAINSLAKVNEQLDTLINAPEFCLQLIKRLAQRFDCSDETAANALQTKEAKHRLTIQKQFEKLFSKPLFNKEKFDNLYAQYKNYIDLDFTYRNFREPFYDDKNTLLINCAMYPSPYKTAKISSLLTTHKININYQNAFKENALMKCAVNCDNPEALRMLCNVPNIQIDLQDQNGDTALIKACLMKVSFLTEIKEKSHKSICIALLLLAGADPEKIDSYGKTPLFILEHMGDNEKEIKLIQNAINKKHAQSTQTPYSAKGFEGQAKKQTKTKKRANKK